ncbi:E3 ubiquitin-protein ligase NRDP1 [Pelomyxa schiedti]|nr:E3 ubiquitin-protein ligase NRDP1 [Pelomyxa schiedti]
MAATSIPEAPFAYVDETQISKHLLCGICQEPFVNAHRSPCSHVFCYACITAWFSKQTGTCPVCRGALVPEQLQKDLLINNMTNELPVYCRNRGQGCTATVQRQNLDSHCKNDCQYGMATCPWAEFGCTQTFARSELPVHREKCPYSQISGLLAYVKTLRTELDALQRQVQQLTATPLGAIGPTSTAVTVSSPLSLASSALLPPSRPTLSSVNLSASTPVAKPAIQIEIGNNHQAVSSSDHRWTLKIQAPGGGSLAGIVTKADVKLHESFPQPNHTLTSHPLQLSGRAWGTFDMKIKLHFAGSVTPCRVVYPLQFNAPWASVIYSFNV